MWFQIEVNLLRLCDYALGVLLRQKRDKTFKAIYYASGTLINAQQKYITIKNRCLLWFLLLTSSDPFIIGSKIAVFIDPTTIGNLFAKKDAKP